VSDAGAAAYRIALPEFEGPLDLLLHLCKTHELDIVNIPIAFVTEKYLEYLELMEAASVDLAADYLVMAATLAYLKSRELVPTPEPLEATADEEELVLDPREELIRRLLEYQKYKDAAERLSGRPIEGRTVFGRGAPIAGDGPRPLAEQSVWKLIEAFGSILSKAGKAKGVHDVIVDRLSIGARINQLVDRLETQGGSFRFDTLFDLTAPEPELRSQVVVTLLAILELAKLKLVRVLQAETEGPIESSLFITTVAGASLDIARRVTTVSSSTEDPWKGAEAEAKAPLASELAEPVAEIELPLEGTPASELAEPVAEIELPLEGTPASEVAEPVSEIELPLEGAAASQAEEQATEIVLPLETAAGSQEEEMALPAEAAETASSSQGTEPQSATTDQTEAAQPAPSEEPDEKA
jgi:segregation and condensation protein A